MANKARYFVLFKKADGRFGKWKLKNFRPSDVTRIEKGLNKHSPKWRYFVVKRGENERAADQLHFQVNKK